MSLFFFLAALTDVNWYLRSTRLIMGWGDHENDKCKLQYTEQVYQTEQLIEIVWLHIAHRTLLDHE